MPFAKPLGAASDPLEGVVQAERLDVASDRLMQIGNRLLLSLPFTIIWDIGQSSREPSLLRIGNQFKW